MTWVQGVSERNVRPEFRSRMRIWLALPWGLPLAQMIRNGQTQVAHQGRWPVTPRRVALTMSVGVILDDRVVVVWIPTPAWSC